MRTMSKKWYYTDPLAAAWMAKHFGMKFTDSLMAVNIDMSVVTPETADNLFEGNDKFTIHPDSLHLLEPQDGDTEHDGFGWNKGEKQWLYFIEDENGQGKLYRKNVGKTHQRNGIVFMWPESEE
jgi:hypothetical protein